MAHGPWGKAVQRKAPGFARRISVGARGRCHEVPRSVVPVALLLDLDDEHSLVNGAVFGLAL